MDEMIVRPKYSRQSSTPRRKRRTDETDIMPTVFAAKLLFVVIFVSVLALCKAANTPATDLFISKVKLITTESFDTNKYLQNAVTTLGLKLPDIKAAATSVPGVQNTDMDSQSDEGTKTLAEENAAVDSLVSGNDSQSTSDKSNHADIIGAISQVPILEEKDLKSLADKYSFIYPIKGEISSPFGIRTSPLDGKTEFHSGIDITANMGTSIKSVLDGEVVEVGTNPEYNKYVKIKHIDGIYTVYARCYLVVAHSGQRVKQGDVVAKVGNAEGLSDPYLHFEIWKDNKAVDPQKLLELLNP